MTLLARRTSSRSAVSHSSPSSGGRGTLDTYSTRHSIADAQAGRQVVVRRQALLLAPAAAVVIYAP
jgi:hypothetical protein